MTKISTKILILQNNVGFRQTLENICNKIAETYAVADTETALNLMSKGSFQLLLLDWHLNPLDASNLFSAAECFQTNVPRISLLMTPDLPNVIAAMKSGASDILWASQEKTELEEKIKESLSSFQPKVYSHSYLARLADNSTEKAMSQKTSLFHARREFSKTFLQQILSRQKLKRTRLAELMGVSPRTLHRHLTA